MTVCWSKVVKTALDHREFHVRRDRALAQWVRRAKGYSIMDVAATLTLASVYRTAEEQHSDHRLEIDRGAALVA